MHWRYQCRQRQQNDAGKSSSVKASNGEMHRNAGKFHQEWLLEGLPERVCHFPAPAAMLIFHAA